MTKTVKDDGINWVQIIIKAVLGTVFTSHTWLRRATGKGENRTGWYCLEALYYARETIKRLHSTEWVYSTNWHFEQCNKLHQQIPRSKLRGKSLEQNQRWRADKTTIFWSFTDDQMINCIGVSDRLQAAIAQSKYNYGLKPYMALQNDTSNSIKMNSKLIVELTRAKGYLDWATTACRLSPHKRRRTLFSRLSFNVI